MIIEKTPALNEMKLACISYNYFFWFVPLKTFFICFILTKISKAGNICLLILSNCIKFLNVILFCNCQKII